MVAATENVSRSAYDVKSARGEVINTRKRVVSGARFSGVAEAASRLGMSRSHAWRVLSGERKSPRAAELRKELRRVRREVQKRASK